MNFKISDLIKIIGNKYGLKLSNEEVENLNKSGLPAEFLEEIKSIVFPLITQEQKLEIESMSIKDIYKFIPKEYADEIKFSDEDGKILLSFSELQKAVKKPDTEIKILNSNENANFQREKLKASYVYGEYPVMDSLENSWRVLESDYEVINREDHPASEPISSFCYYTDLGFYPPPEILMVVSKGFQLYFDLNGKFSLDEVFFSEKFKKTNNPAYKRHKKFKYAFFDIELSSNKHKGNNISLEQAAENIIKNTNPLAMAYLGFDPNVDVDTFLRGYRRWKRDLKDGKFE